MSAINFEKNLWVALAFALALSSCAKVSQSPLGVSSASPRAGAQLSDEENELAHSSTNIILKSETSLVPELFNLVKWPLDCGANAAKEDIPDNPCKNVSGNVKVGLRNIKVTGIVLIIDPNEAPWAEFQNQRNVRALAIEADKIVVRGHLRLPSTTLQIRAREMVFEDGGVLDVTPVAQFGHQPFAAGASKGANGADGLPGSNIIVNAESVQMLGDSNNPRLIAQGGQGQRAGDGWGSAQDEKDQYAGGMAVIAGGNVPAQFNSIRDAVVYRSSYCSGSWSDACHSVGPDHIQSCKIFYESIGQAGSNAWPQEGRDAIPGGAPGAGGRGGRIDIVTKNSVQIPAQLLNTSAGTAGESDGLRRGMKGGLPNPAYHIDAVGACSQGNQQAMKQTSHTQRDGANAQAPQKPDHQNDSGKISVIQQALVGPSSDYLQLKLNRIKDVYYSRQFAKAAALINGLQEEIDQVENLESGLATKSIQAQLAKYAQNIMAQKDFFGRGLNDAPSFTFEFNLARYDTQAEEAMSVYYLSTLFTNRYAQKKATLEDAKFAMEALASQINSNMEQIDKADSELSQIGFEVDSVKANQDSFQHEIDDIKEQIRKQAETNVSIRHQQDHLFKLLDVACSIAQVFPAGQPALAIGATILKSVVKGPKTKDLGGWIDYASDLSSKGQKITSDETWTKSKGSWDDFVKKLNPNQLNGMSLKEKAKYLSEVGKELAPTAQAFAEGQNALAQPTYGASEIEQEIAKLQAENALFQQVAAKLRELMAQKAQLQRDVITFTNLVSGLTAQISDFVAIDSLLSEQTLQGAVVDDPALKNVFAQLSKEQEYRLMYLYDELVRSYNYVSLSQLPHPMEVRVLRAKIEDLIQKNTSPDEAVKILSSFFKSQRDVIRNSIADLLSSTSNPLVLVRPATFDIQLDKKQVGALNRSGFVEFPLKASSYFKRGNVRIDSIEILESGSKVSVPHDGKAYQGDEGLSLRLSLGSEGSFNMPNAPTYYYPKLGALFTWEYTFQLQNGQWQSQANNYSRDAVGLIGALIDDAKALQNSPIFTMHGGITNLRIETVGKKGPMKVDGLGVRVHYKYSFACKDMAGSNCLKD